MDQQQQQQQQQQQGGQPPPSSPVRGVASAVAQQALAAGSVAVARSVSIQSTESHGTASIGTEDAGGSAGNMGGSGATGGGSVQSVASGSLAETLSVSGSRSGSFRASPAVTPREQPGTGVPPFPTQAAGIAQPPQPAVAPPPWPTTSTPAATPQRASATQQQPVGRTPNTNRTASPLPPPPAGTPSLENTPVSYPGAAAAGPGPMPPPPLGGAPSFPPPIGAGSLSLSMTKSGESLFSQPPPVGASASGAASQGAMPGAGPGVDSSVLLGLEELERQQADAEKRKAEKLWEEERMKREVELQTRQMQQQQQLRTMPGPGAPGGGGPPQQPQPPPPTGLPPLAPHPPRPSTAPGAGPYPEVPQQIHLTDDNEEDTILSSDVDRKELKRVTSIEKLRGSVQVGLRRFRSWSQDALNRASMDNPAASSVDSTQNATLTSGEEGGGPPPPKRPSGEGASPQQQESTPKSGNKKQQLVGPSVVSEPYLDDDELKPLIYGYLHKLGRNGHWQKRFFETNGERLTYYKSVKRNKVLATLDLCKVGEIAIDETDPEECTFTIQVKNRPYFLRAEDKARCNDWVITLNRAREARMNVGHIHLNAPKMEPGEGGTHRSQAGSDDYAPMIVISALRPRTRADRFGEGGVDGLPPDLLTSNNAASQEEGEEIEVTRWDENRRSTSGVQQGVVGVVGGGAASPSASSPVGGDTSMAKWQKRHSKMHVLSLRFLKWARSITHQADACRKVEKDVVVVPAHVMQHLSATATSGAAVGAAAAAASGAGGVQPGTKQTRSPSGLPGLLEETQAAPSTPGAPENAVRSRANTESPAFEAC